VCIYIYVCILCLFVCLCGFFLIYAYLRGKNILRSSKKLVLLLFYSNPLNCFLGFLVFVTVRSPSSDFSFSFFCSQRKVISEGPEVLLNTTGQHTHTQREKERERERERKRLLVYGIVL
jgi:hypothetical protein